MRLLREITEKTLREVSKKEYVTPDEYASIFKKYAVELGIDTQDFNEEYFINNGPVVAEVLAETKIEAKNLTQHTHEAKVAIENKDVVGIGVVERQLEQLESRLKDLEARLFKDELTGVKNFNWLAEEYKNKSLDPKTSIVFMDINNFKGINDSYGHNVGDEALKFFASRLNNFLENESLPIGSEISFVRKSGDEFLLIAEGIHSDAVKLVVEKAKIYFQQHHMYIRNENNLSIQVDFSYGIHTTSSSSLLSEAIELADSAMYEHKRESKKSKSNQINMESNGIRR